MVATPARKSGRSETGTSAADAILARTHVATSSFEYLTKYRASGSASPFHGFSALVWHMKGGSVVLICTFLAPKFGLTKGPSVKTPMGS
eukprot:7717013-Pyramimonas_sp.AAC.1